MGLLRGPGSLTDPDVGRHLLRDEGEVIVDEVRRHWIVYTGPLALAAIGVLLLFSSVFTALDLAGFQIIVGLLIVTWAGWKALAHHLDVFVITNMRVFRVHGVLARSLATMPLSRILDISVYKPLHGRILGFGHFVFESAAQAQGLREIRWVARPDQRDLAIQRVVQRAGLRGAPRVN